MRIVIHLEKTDKGAGAKRARYNSALMDADITVLGEELFNDEAHIIYVNGEYKGNDPIGDLMHDFHCKKADDMKNKILAERTRYLKENEKGVKHMCRIMEQMAKEERLDEKYETIAKLLESALFYKLPAIRFHILTPFLVGKLVVLPPFRGAILPFEKNAEDFRIFFKKFFAQQNTPVRKARTDV